MWVCVGQREASLRARLWVSCWIWLNAHWPSTSIRNSMAQLPLRTWTGSLCPPSASTEMCRSVCVKVPCLTAMENNQLPDGLPWLLTSVKCLLQNNSMKKQEELNSRIARKNGSPRRDSVHRCDGLTQTCIYFKATKLQLHYCKIQIKYRLYLCSLWDILASKIRITSPIHLNSSNWYWS